MMRLAHLRRSNNNRSAFTLIELLIVISIISLILVITIPAVRFGMETERVRGGASQVQSYIAGARDRAIYAKAPVGVRLFLDNTELLNSGGTTFPGGKRMVTSMVYINPAQTWSDGTIQLQRLDADNDGTVDTSYDLNGDGDIGNPSIGSQYGDLAAENAGQSVYVVAGVGTGWWELKRRGMLVDGLKIEVPAGGTAYPISTILIDTTAPPTAVQKLILQIPYRDEGSTPDGTVAAFSGGGPEGYSLQLPPAILPGQPSILPDRVAIDLDASALPAAWLPSATNGFNFNPYMDIIFSPRGNVIGAAASAGIIQLYVGDVADTTELKQEFIESLPGADLAEQLVNFNAVTFVPADEIDPGITATSWVDPLAVAGDPYIASDRRAVTIFTQTGAISVHAVSPVDVLDPLDLDGDMDNNEPDGLADFPYGFTIMGEEAN